MINTQTQIDSLIDLAVIQRTELKQLIESLPQLRDHLSSEIERNLEEIEPAIRSELEQFVAARALDTQAKTSAELSAKLDAMARNLESTTAAKYSVLMAERAQNATLLAQAEARITEAASALPGAVKGIVTDELSRFPRAGEIDQLRREFAEPRGLNPRGRWQVGETYNKLDLVSYNGDSYVSSTDGNREKPSRSTDAWTLSAARGNGGGGGGVTSLTDLVAVPANGELLIGNGSAFVNNTITGGTGVTVTNGPGTITIDASGAQELLTATVTNAESFAITRGQVVYLFGATGNRASVKLADNSNDAASSKTFGVVSEASISAGGNGLVTCVGVVTQLTLGTYTEGDVLYLGATPGAFTNVKPYAPNHLVYVGMVERANNGNGEVYVRIQNGFELDEIHDVQITTPPLAGALLMRDATNSLWKANRLTGTANQVTVTNADTAVTLSLPTTIANVNSVTAQSATDLTLAGGSSGASLVLGQGATASSTITNTGTGNLAVVNGDAANVLILSRNSGVTNVGTAIKFRQKDSGGTYVDIGDFYAAKSVATAGAVNSFFAWGTRRAGTLTDAMMLPSTGNLLIGTTTDISGTGGLHVAGTGTATSSSNGGALRVGTNVAMSGNAGGASYFGGAATFAGAVSVAGTLSGTGTNTWALQSVGASGALVAGGWLYGINNGFNITPNGAGVAGATFMLAAFDGTGYREMLSTANVASGASTLRLAGYGGPTTVGGSITVSGNATFAGAVTAGGKIQSSVSTATGYNQLYDTSGITTGRGAFAITSTGAGLAFGIEASAGGTSFTGSTAYASYFGTTTATPIHFVTNSVIRQTIDSTGAATFAGAVTVSSSTASTNTTSGALVVTGGVGVGGALNVGGAVTVASAIVKRASTAADGFTTYFTGGTQYWDIGLQAVGTSNDFRIVNSQSGNRSLSISSSTEAATFAGLIFPQQAATAPTYVKGAIYFDTTLNKLRVGGATGWETITSV